MRKVLSAFILCASCTAAQTLMDQASGTSRNPRSAPMPMVMKSAGEWSFMFMGQAFLIEGLETGARGGDKLFSTNYGMFGAEHKVGKGSFQFETMLSLEPATITGRRYPELFQTGETAFGKPLVDAQHPHDLIMSLGVHYSRPLSERTTLLLYFAPVGDPALGPVAFPHRASAAELPLAPLSHHWQDSTHIANEVVTAGIDWAKLRLEASGFHGGEPNENRWNIDHGAIDSWSVRLSASPARNWLAQVSMGRLARPELQEPGDVVRTTASLQYTRPMRGGSWSSSVVWGRNHRVIDQRNGNSFLLESVIPVGRSNFLTGRAELVDKDELFEPEVARRIGESFRVGAYTVGYTRDLGTWWNVQTGLGASLIAYSMPAGIKPFYGERPLGVQIYLRLRLNPGT